MSGLFGTLSSTANLVAAGYARHLLALNEDKEIRRRIVAFVANPSLPDDSERRREP